MRGAAEGFFSGEAVMARRTISQLISQRPTNEELRKLFLELRGMHDRAAAIVVATLVEDALEKCLTTKMIRLSNSDHKTLFDGEGPLSSFASKIKVGYAFKCLDRVDRTEITTIKDVRNIFAHARIPVSFELPEIRMRIKNIKIVKRFINPAFEFLDPKLFALVKGLPTKSTRDQFLSACALYHLLLPLGIFGPDDLGED
jgi:DNA-binding MltR family transcriptional regulator